MSREFDHANDLRRSQRSFGYQWTLFGEMTKQFEEDFLKYLDPESTEFFRGKLGLDAGCGFGRHLYYATKFGATMVGLDFSVAIHQAKKIVGNDEAVKLVQGDVLRPPFASESFDFVYSIGVLHHLPDPEAGFRELVSLVRPGGTIFVWVYSNARIIANSLLEATRQVTKRLPLYVIRKCALAGALLDWCGFILPYRLYRRVFGADMALTAFSRIRLYARYPFQVVYADWFDRLAAPIRHYLDGADMERWAKNAELVNVRISPTGLYGWRMSAERPRASEVSG